MTTNLSTSQARIVIGVDGSPQSRQALQWSAHLGLANADAAGEPALTCVGVPDGRHGQQPPGGEVVVDER